MTLHTDSNRPYEQSHPWINFRVDLTRALPHFWMRLGEAYSKSHHITGAPLPSAVDERLHQLYLAKGVLGTTAIEGNTLTEAQVIEQLKGTLVLPPSKEYLRQEVQNIVDGCREIADALRVDGPSYLSVELIMHFNELVLRGLQLEPEVQPGKLRKHSVTVGHAYRGAPAEDCGYLLSRLCDWLNEFDEPSYPREVIAFIKAVLAHLYIAWIHPFGDGNGRTARLVEFYILANVGLPSPVCHLLSNHYNETRTHYYLKLNEARRDVENPLPFLQYAIEGLVDGLKEQLREIRDHQWDLTWKDHVMDLFRHLQRPSDRRKLHLLIDLAERKQTLPIAEVHLVTPRIAAEYSRVSQKTILRDLQALEELGLLEIENGRVRVMREIVLRFLPFPRTKTFFEDTIIPLVASRVMPDFHLDSSADHSNDSR